MIPLFKVHMPPGVEQGVGATLRSGFIGEGPRVKEFEALLASYIGNPFCLALNSCTSAIQLALRLAGVGPGDDVVTTPMTCTATNEPILAAGANIVWADIDPATGNISPESVAKRITPSTKAILVVHWGGTPVDLAAIHAIADRRGIKVIEDAAHAFGAEYRGAKIGTHSDFVCFSFQAIKHITTGDGGALFCKSEADYKRGKLLRWYGIDREQPRADFRCEADIAEWGYKFHMNDIAATLGIEQMPHVESILRQRRALADYYTRELSGTPGVRIIEPDDDIESAFWFYTLLVDDRASFMAHMKECGVTVSQVHARNDKHTMFREFAATLPGVDAFTRDMVCLPVGFWIGDIERAHIVESVRECSRQCNALPLHGSYDAAVGW